MMLYVLLMWLLVVNVVQVDTSDVATWTTSVLKIYYIVFTPLYMATCRRSTDIYIALYDGVKTTL